MKLSEYATKHGIKYRAAWNRFKAGKIPGAYTDDLGRIVVPRDSKPVNDKAVVYARVSSHKQVDDLDRQAVRVSQFANSQGFIVVKTVKEVASGVNDQRPKLSKVLKDEGWGVLIVEHRDRLTRVGFNWFELFLSQQGRRVIVLNDTEENTDLMDDFLSIIYSFAARLYGLRSAKHRTRVVADSLGVSYDDRE